MALTKKGSIEEYYSDGVAIQPNFSLTEKNDGTIEGQVVFICDITKFQNLPQMGSAHPRESRCELYNREITYMGLRRVQMTGSYFGLVSKTTEGIISYAPNTNQDSITSHPNFSTLAGSPGAPANGASWIYQSSGLTVGEEYINLDVSGTLPAVEFVGFTNPANDMFATDFYLTEAVLVSRTFWTSEIPKPKERQIVDNIKGFVKPKDCKNFLLFSPPYRQVGSFYQVTEQYIGSGINGWNTKVYAQS